MFETNLTRNEKKKQKSLK